MMKKIDFFKVIFLWGPIVVWACVIFYLSSIPTLRVTEFFFWDFIAKKAAHVFVYSVLFILIYRATANIFTSFALTIIYAATDEYHQHFVPGRSATPLDLGFDVSGANIAAYTIWKLKQIRPKKHKK